MASTKTWTFTYKDDGGLVHTITSITTTTETCSYDVGNAYAGKRIYVKCEDSDNGCALESFFDVPQSSSTQDCESIPGSNDLIYASTFETEVECDVTAVTVSGNYTLGETKYSGGTCGCEPYIITDTHQVSEEIQLDPHGNIGGATDKIYEGLAGGYINYKIVQKPCMDCSGLIMLYDDSPEPYQVVNVTCVAQDIEVTGELPYSAITKTIVCGECQAETVTGLSAVTVQYHVTVNPTPSTLESTVTKVIPDSGGAKFKFTLRQAPCTECKSEVIYGTSPVVYTSATCSAQYVHMEGQVPYTSYTRHLDYNTDECITDSTIIDTSAVTIDIYVTKNEGSERQISDEKDHVRYVITQAACGECNTGTTYEYGVNEEYATASTSCVEGDVDVTSNDVPYTATTITKVGDQCLTSTTENYSSITATVHVGYNSGSSSRTLTGITNHVKYSITQSACGECNTGTTYIYVPTENVFTASISCSRSRVMASDNVPYTATTISLNQGVCETSTTTGTSAITTAVIVSANEGFEPRVIEGQKKYVNYRITQESCKECEEGTFFTYGANEEYESAITSCADGYVQITSDMVPFTATTVTINGSECHSANTTGYTSFTATIHVDYNSGSGSRTLTGEENHVRYFITQKPCDDCPTGTTYIYLPSETTSTTSVTCEGGTVRFTNNTVKYTATTTTQTLGVCTSTTQIGYSSVTINIDVPQYEGFEPRTITGMSKFVNYSITQSACHTCDTGTTYQYGDSLQVTKISTGCAATSFTFANDTIPYTATTVTRSGNDCVTSTTTDTSGATITVSVSAYEGYGEKVTTGTTNHVRYEITQTACHTCETGTTYQYGDSTTVSSAETTCAGGDVSLTNTNVPFTATTVSLINDTCTSTTRQDTSSVTINVNVPSYAGYDDNIIEGKKNHVRYKIVQKPCHTCETGTTYQSGDSTSRTSAETSCEAASVHITSSTIPVSAITVTLVGGVCNTSTTTSYTTGETYVAVGKNTGDDRVLSGTSNHIKYHITQKKCFQWKEPNLFDYVFDDGTVGPDEPSPGDDKTIIGICVVPSGHTPDGHARIMAVTTKYTVNGWSWDTSSQKTSEMYTGVGTVLSSSVSGVDGGTWDGVKSTGYLPSTYDLNGLYSGAQVYGRTERYSTSVATDTNIASPYNRNGAKNPHFAYPRTPLSDYDGYQNTLDIIASSPDDPNTAAAIAYDYANNPTSIIPDTFASYLPSAAEYAYVIVNMKEVQAKLQKSASLYIEQPIQIDLYSSIWTSNEYSESKAWIIRHQYGNVEGTTKNQSGTIIIRPFLKWIGDD